MICKLIKKVTKKVVNGKEYSFVKYHLVFNNGKKARITPEYINPDYFEDEKQKEDIKESNKYNAFILSTLADLDENE